MPIDTFDILKNNIIIGVIKEPFRIKYDLLNTIYTNDRLR